MDGLVTRAIANISARSGIALEPCTVSWAGAASDGFRPSGIPEGRGFSIALSRTAYRAQALFISDNFAGALLREMGMRSVTDLRWKEMMAEGTGRGIDTVVMVNSLPVTTETTELPLLWQTLEVECSTRIPRTTPAEDASQLVAVGLQCLMMVLAGLDLDEEDDLSAQSPVEGALEGALRSHQAARYERSRVNRLRCIEIYGTDCWVCDFSFGSAYGSVGAEFIEVHHRVPLAEVKDEYVVDPRRDLVPLCSNCHSIIHRRHPVYQPDELRDLIGRPKKELPAPSIPIP